ncbi:allantoate amidohydrolase [Paraglaciecola chathamensis]|uniref:N-carbamoyl-L-amino acid hydrolase n=1 Tax=Paraglaciecola chathamensis S18K6 TaxID=1127672 RepID=A0AAV3V5F1_9ALTE|nr:allantoate amidohydrolase [Paraglaciecola chathamensis]GAC11930.1 N-carbamoyl-L-amino acid hydrolase [Paraglaciecola chathamensis S18K6]
MTTLAPYAIQTYERCDVLAHFSQDPDCINRQYLTPEHLQANRQVAQWMEQAGMETWQDAAANQWGRYPSKAPNAKTLVIGSHLDTVPNSGKYDGILGVLAPLSLIHYLHDHHIELPFHLELVGFGDEEGTRFGATLLGSCAVAGTWQEKWNDLSDENGITLRQAFIDAGLDISEVKKASRQETNVDDFFEFHIEQGPVLEQNDLAVGVVNGIAGAKRFSITLKGLAGHAGTVPMPMRQDALAAASEMILAIERLATEKGIVATVGHLKCLSGAVNVISGATTFSLDIRSIDDALRDETLKLIIDELKGIAETRRIQMDITPTHQAPAVKCDENLQLQLLNAFEETDTPPFTLASGAGHDTMAMAAVCPVAMMFMRCEKGLSHHPAEAIDVPDIEAALKVMFAFLKEYV